MMTDMQGSAGEMEILREELPIRRFAGEGLSQAVVEGEVALPGGLREETNVLCAEAAAVLDKSTADAGRVTAEGKVTFHVLYTQGDPTRVSTLEAGADFSHAMELAGAQAGMHVPVSLMVEHVEASAQGGRLRLMAVVRVHARAFTDEPISVVTGLRGVPGLMLRTETLPCLSPAASGQRDVLVRDECDLGALLQITDTLQASAIATVQEVMGGEDRVTLSGSIQLEVTHLSDMPSRPVVVTRHSIPFEETVPISGDAGDCLACCAVVRDVAVLSQEGAQAGERTLRAEVLLGLQASGCRKRSACLMLDAYTTQGDAVTLQTQRVSRALSHSHIHTAESGKMTLLLDGQPPVRTPLRASLRPIVTDLTPQNGRLLVEGMMEVTVLYMTDDTAAPQSFSTEEPFRMVFACDPAIPSGIVLTPASVDAVTVTSDRVEVKYILHLDADDVQLASDALVTQAGAHSAEAAEPGIVVYFSQAGESLWDIAKRYRVSVDSLRRMNPDLSSEGTAQPVLLWMR